MHRNLSNIALLLIVAAALCIMSTPSRADWDPFDPDDQARAKWIQLPDLSETGLDVLDTLQPFAQPPNLPQWKILADDFLCTQSGPITDVHMWGSWLNNILPQTMDATGLLVPDAGALRFKLSFHSDVPANPTDPLSYSQPGPELWSAIFNPGQFQVNPNYVTFPIHEGFYDPNLDQVIGSDDAIYQYNFTTLLDANGLPFVQTAGNIYWLDVQTEVFNLAGVTPATFGWKTREAPLDPSKHFMDDAVFADTAGFAGGLITPWKDMHYPVGHPAAGLSMDLSFVLTVPEPSSIAMAGLGLVALVGMVYRRRKRQG